eukprot:scaffold125461_cov66-Phaeocystis_antarctica.AAC.2
MAFAAPCGSGTQRSAGVGPSRPRGYRSSQTARRPGGGGLLLPCPSRRRLQPTSGLTSRGRKSRDSLAKKESFCTRKPLTRDSLDARKLFDPCGRIPTTQHLGASPKEGVAPVDVGRNKRLQAPSGICGHERVGQPHRVAGESADERLAF